MYLSLSIYIYIYTYVSINGGRLRAPGGGLRPELEAGAAPRPASKYYNIILLFMIL